MSSSLAQQRRIEARPSALSLDLGDSCSRLLADPAAAHALPPTARAVLEQWASGQGSSNRKPQKLLQTLSDLLIVRSLTIAVAAHFRPLLIDLTARLVSLGEADSWQDQRCLAMLYAFANLLAPFPEIYPVVSEFLALLASRGDFLGDQLESLSQADLNLVLLSTARLCFASRPLAAQLQLQMPAKVLHSIYIRPEQWGPASRLIAIKLQSMMEGLPEASRQELEVEFVGQPTVPSVTSSSNEAAAAMEMEVYSAVDDFRISIFDDGKLLDSVDVWVLALAEKGRQHDARKRTRAIESLLTFHQTEEAQIKSTSLSASVKDVAGVLIFRSRDGHDAGRHGMPEDASFVLTPSHAPALNSVAQGLVRRLPILLSGPPSSGKTSLLEHLSSTLHPRKHRGESQIVTLQLGDHSSLDAKSLIGTYTSSARNPGTFEWVEGALTRAVRDGKWLVLEDIDKASGEILSVIKPLVEAFGPSKRLGASAELDLGAKGKIVAGPNFALFAVRSVNPSRARDGSIVFSPPAFIGSSHWTEVACPAPAEDDVTHILQELYPRLCQGKHGDQLLRKLINAWRALQASSTSSQAQQVPVSSRRQPTLRDLMKWCRRVESFLVETSMTNASLLDDQRHMERLFVEAAEVFLGAYHISTSQAVDAFFKSSAEALGLAIGLSADRAWWLLQGRTPDLTLKGNLDALDSATSVPKLKMGRVELLRQPKAHSSTSSAVVPTSRSFALTRPAAVLLERVAASVALSEPVLLVGETGTGKTTSVQHLASLLGQPMVALNLSQQTEAADLLGSYKPLEPRLPAMEIHNVWFDLFERTFSAKRNARFVELERKALQTGKWARLATLWKESIRMADERRSRKLKLLDEAKEKTEPALVPISTSRSIKKRKTARGHTPVSPDANAGEEAERAAEDSLDRLWQSFGASVSDFAVQHASRKRNFVFSFIEGPLVKAIQDGSWVLLDEINLAASETLDSLASLLQSSSSSITLFEKGDIEPIKRHPNFRLFACMNPATDVGKKDLPASLRSRFTELYVQSPDADREALIAIVEKYIGHLTAGDRSALLDVSECYAEIRRLASEHLLADGANQRPHFSIRTLSRALTFASDQAGTYGLRRALWEGFTMAFTMLLDDKSATIVRELLSRQILSRARNANAAASFVPARPKKSGASEEDFIQIGPFWLQTGPEPLDPATDYILTASVQAKLIGLARAILARKSPVLIQGPTSAGKTSAVEYLARRTGHRFVRINNHEHTDVQEYLGSYASDPDTGRLVFHEGLLVQALRRGDWIVLDELNLAPTDVLEALNRLLDDNRELVIPETGEVVKPHPRFMLFATQNPPGIYAGRKVLSRAFRNRFLEVHFDDVPRAELEKILSERCKIPLSYAGKVVAVFVELQKRRQAGRVFDSNQAFVTLRDLFRWGQREAQGYQQLAEDGYMLIAERARRADDKLVVKEVIEEVMKVRIDEDAIYDVQGAGKDSVASRVGGLPRLQAMLDASGACGIVWTRAMQRLLCLVATCLRYDEPVLLVGETGSGKTSVCGVLAQALGCQLHTVNCHQNTDTADLLGGQRPIRNRGALLAKARTEAERLLLDLGRADVLASSEEVDLQAISSALALALTSLPAEDPRKAEGQATLQQINQASALFEWRDGPLVDAMRAGDHLLLDEMSLADDSVLERLNSVLEPGRTLVLAERSGASTDSSEPLNAIQIKARDGFQIIATMNPGGDYGKKELSPALRNRFTEIWVPQVEDRRDILQIFETQWRDESLSAWGPEILNFAEWFIHHVGGDSNAGDRAGIGLRDYISWVAFINATAAGSTPVLDGHDAYAHGALLTFVDGIGALAATSAMTTLGLRELRDKCLKKLQELCGERASLSAAGDDNLVPSNDLERFAIGPFSINRGPVKLDVGVDDFSFRARTTAKNAVKVLRALYVPTKSILLEGSPGAGKTSLIGALAKASGNYLTRINLSDQTELIDLFGADLPVEGGGPGEFAWKDAAFLRAMERGEWVLLDEMNLASQSVLEGLNSCLDHRGSVYIPELGRSFEKHPDFRLFAAQNPHQQGGGRKGLPKSFLNRFTKVYVDELRAEDILTICAHLYPGFPRSDLEKMIAFNTRLHEEVMVKHSLGRQGSPWEFNLRDLLRWLTLIHSDLGLNWAHRPVEHLAALYIQRFRNQSDRRAAAAIYTAIFEHEYDAEHRPWAMLTPHHVQFGHVLLDRKATITSPWQQQFALLQRQLPALESLADCVRLQWLSIVVGPAGCGKTSLVRLLASVTGRKLQEMRMNSGIDTMDVLGTFEQLDPLRKLRLLVDQAKQALDVHHLHALRSSSKTSMASWNAARTSLAACSHFLGQSTGAQSGSEAATRQLADNIDSLATSEGLDHLAHLAAAVRTEASAAQSASAAGRFEWNDGPLLKAMQEGTWLLLDDANLCSASVLDRLNSLFEPGGSLILSERGVVDGEIKTIRPHPDFRLFMALDPQHGELSRAMRNRGLEVYLASRDGSVDSASCDAQRLASLDCFDSSASSLPDSSIWDLEETSLGRADHAIQLAKSDSFSETGVGRFLTTSLPVLQVALASRAVSSLERGGFASIATLLQDDATRQVISRGQKAWQDRHAVAATFVQEQANDLGHNPNLWDDGVESAQTTRSALSLLYDALFLQKSLHNVATEAAHLKQAEGASVLQRSARFAAQRSGQDNVDEDQSVRLLYPFLRAIASSAQAAAGSTDDAETLKMHQAISDRGIYLLTVAGRSLFDFSAIQIVMGDIYAFLNQLKGSGKELMELATVLYHRVALTSGFAMKQIWELSMPTIAFAEAQECSRVLLQLLSAVVPQPSNKQLIATAIDVAATLQLPEHLWTTSQRGDVLSLAQDVIKRLSEAVNLGESRSKGTITKAKTTTWEIQCLAAVELQIRALRASPLLPAISSEGLKEVVDSSAYPLRAGVTIRQLGWQAGREDQQSGTVAMSIDGFFDWVAPLAEDGPGCEELFRPFLLKHALFPSPASRITLSELLVHRQQCARLGRLTSLLRPATSTSRSGSLLQELADFVAVLLNALEPEQEVATDDDRASAAQKAIQKAKENIQSHMRSLNNVDNETDSGSLTRLGQSCISIALEVLALYLPNVAIDPLSSLRTREWMAQDQISSRDEQVRIARYAEDLLTGNTTSPMIRFLTGRLDETLAEQRSVVSKSAVSRQPDLAILTRFFGDVHSFTRQMLDPAKLKDLTDQLETSCNDQSIARERSLQASLQSFRSRLTSEYQALADLCAPLATVTSMLQIGFRSLLASSLQARAPSAKKRNEGILDALVKFPSTCSSEQFAQMGLPIKVKAGASGGSSQASLAVPMLLTVLAGLSQDVADGKAPNGVLRLLSRSYDQLFFIWTLDKEEERQAAQAEASLFKSRDLDIEDKDDPEVQEAEFRSMFPDYSEDVLDSSASSTSSGTASKTHNAYLRPEYLLRLHKLHLAIFLRQKSKHRTSESRIFREMRTDLARSLLTSSYDSLTEKLDKAGEAFQLSLLHSEAGLDASDATAPNFYLDANIAETSKGTEIVLGMRERLDELIKEWPDQMIPQHIRDRCDAILRLDSKSPVAKILAALEQLFTHTDDWEGYANSSNSLEKHREKIRKQISDWRLLELHSWAKLLDTQAEQHTASVSEWWFRLFEVAVRGMQAATAESEQKGNEHLSSLVVLLDQFIRSSDFGQYEARLDLVSSFGNYLDLLTQHAPACETQGLDKVSRVLQNVSAFYSQFKSSINELYSKQRAKIEKEIRDFIQLTRWKDINILSLRASAQKTHRKLHKCVRNFRTILRQPVDPILAGFSESKVDVAQHPGKEIGRRHLPVPLVGNDEARAIFASHESSHMSTDASGRPQHLQNLGRTYEILHQLADKDLSEVLCAVHVDGLQELATAIIEQSRALAQATPALQKEDNIKVIKNLTNRKRKAWTDLLREMKRIGLSPFVSPDIVSRNQDASFVYGQKVLNSEADDEGARDVDAYFYRLLTGLPRMRESLQAAQGDLPMSELQRGASYCEHAMSIVFQERERLAGLLASRSSLNALAARLQKTIESSGSDMQVKRCPHGILTAVETLTWTLHRVVAALLEIDGGAVKHAAVSSLSSKGIEVFRQELSQERIEAANLAKTLSELNKSLQSCHEAFWTSEEETTVSSAVALLPRLADRLAACETAIPALAPLCVPTYGWLRKTSMEISEAFKASNTQTNGSLGTEPVLKTDAVITSILLIAQEVRKLPSSLSSDKDAEDLADKAIVSDLRSLRAAERTLRLPEIMQQISVTLSGDEPLTKLARIAPFVAVYAQVVSAHINSSSRWLQSFSKLNHIMTNTVTSLCLKGFCKPPEQDDSKDADAAGEGKELEGGTGLGDGTGAQDITDQMDEDETIEELQKNEDEENGDAGDEFQREKGAREAEDDFGGDLEEVSANGDDQDDGEEEQDGPQEEPDDHVGDVDPLDPNAVDEKIWSGEQDKEDQKGQSKDETSKDLDGPDDENEDSAPKQEGGKEDDKSRGESANDKQKQQGEEAEQEQGPKDDGDEAVSEELEGNEDGEQQEEGDGEIEAEEDAGQEQQGAGRKMDDTVDQGDNLDIDDELKMSDDEGGANASDIEDDLNDIDLDDEGESGEGNMPEQEEGQDLPFDAQEEFEKTEAEPEEGQDAEPSEAEVAKNEGEEAMEEDDEDGEDDAERQDGVDAHDHADADGDLDEGADPLPDDDMATDTQAAGDVSASASQSQGARGRQGRQAAHESRPDAPEGKAEADNDTAEQDDGATAPKDKPSTSAAGQKATEEGDATEQQQDDAEKEANPVRSLGDALKQFRRNLDSIAEATPDNDADEAKPTEEKKADGEGMPEDGEVEHIADDQDAEMQALGAADEEEATQRLAESRIEDENQASDMRPAGGDADEDHDMQDDVPNLEQAPLPDFDQEEALRQQSSSEQRQKQEQSSKALLPSDIQQQAELDARRQSGVDEQRQETSNEEETLELVDGEHEEELIDPVSDEVRQLADHDVEEELAAFRSLDADERAEKAAELWRSYSTMTSDLAFALCEQLRLILTPTLAARLNGDFRTGKRLNMRKIVPFIASDFAKDKIWLRRTKPSKREYQVLLALDDSRSMAENRSVHLAYQTLALVSGALGRLEVGDISICRFGEKVQTLHPFGKGTFGDESGGQILNQLSFEQKGTNMVRLVEHTLNSLQEARNTRSSSSGSSAADLWQLEIIISDGVCQDHERLRSLLRRANEQRVMIVFVIVDSLASGSGAGGQSNKAKQGAAANSILSMSSVRYETDPATGRMELKMDRYLDTFPFSYYVVLREAEALPEVLSTTLRQWAEKIREAE